MLQKCNTTAPLILYESFSIFPSQNMLNTDYNFSINASILEIRFSPTITIQEISLIFSLYLISFIALFQADS